MGAKYCDERVCVSVCVYISVHLHISKATRLNFTEFFSERELTFTFAICYRPSVCLLSVVCRLSSVVCLSVTFVRPTQAVQIFGNISTVFGTLAIR